MVHSHSPCVHSSGSCCSKGAGQSSIGVLPVIPGKRRIQSVTQAILQVQRCPCGLNHVNGVEAVVERGGKERLLCQNVAASNTRAW